MLKINDRMKDIEESGRLALMGHIVASYPDKAGSIAAAKGICETADFLEVQFPFSDPSADGPVIESACYVALESGFRTEDGFDIVKELSSTTKTAIIIMTYANIIFRYGIDRFVMRAKEAGAQAFIVPDLPAESDEGLLEAARGAGIALIQVVSPGADAERIKYLSAQSDGLLYVTARRGITGSTTTIGAEVFEWIDFVIEHSLRPIALGFGIKSNEQVKELKGKVPVVVAGSYFVETITKLAPGDDATAKLSEAAQVLMK